MTLSLYFRCHRHTSAQWRTLPQGEPTTETRSMAALAPLQEERKHATLLPDSPAMDSGQENRSVLTLGLLVLGQLDACGGAASLHEVHVPPHLSVILPPHRPREPPPGHRVPALSTEHLHMAATLGKEPTSHRLKWVSCFEGRSFFSDSTVPPSASPTWY